MTDLLRDREFLKLLFGFGLGLGIFNGLTTVIEQLVKPCGYTSVRLHFHELINLFDHRIKFS